MRQGLCVKSHRRGAPASPSPASPYYGCVWRWANASSSIRIWDLKAQSKAADFAGHSGAITALAFSENGYYLASASADATVKFWDLRKLKAFHTLEFHAGYEVQRAGLF